MRAGSGGGRALPSVAATVNVIDAKAPPFAGESAPCAMKKPTTYLRKRMTNNDDAYSFAD
jgi:hypothetical protein